MLPREFPVSIKPNIREDDDNDFKFSFEKRLKLVSSENWVLIFHSLETQHFYLIMP
jgi:hypothetical protein